MTEDNRQLGELTFGGLRYNDEKNCIVDGDNQQVELRPKTLKVFRHLVQHHDTVVSRDSLIESVWPDVVVTEASLTQCVAEIRKKLGADPQQILKTIPKRGYQLLSDTRTDNAIVVPPGTGQNTSSQYQRSVRDIRRRLFVGAVSLFLIGVIFFQFNKKNTVFEQSTPAEGGSPGTTGVSAVYRAPTVSLSVSVGDQTLETNLLRQELTVSLAKYKTVELVDAPDSNYTIFVQPLQSSYDEKLAYTVVSMLDNLNSNREVLLERIEHTPESDVRQLAARISAMIASVSAGSDRGRQPHGHRPASGKQVCPQCLSAGNVHGVSC